MLTIIIKDFKICLKNSNLPIRKGAIDFKPLAQIKRTTNQTAGILYY